MRAHAPASLRSQRSSIALLGGGSASLGGGSAGLERQTSQDSGRLQRAALPPSPAQRLAVPWGRSRSRELSSAGTPTALVAPSARSAELREIIEDCEAKEVECRAAVRFWERCWERRRQPVADQLEVLDHEKEVAVTELNAELERIKGQEAPLPPGPHCLSWVQSDWFGALCNVVVALNLAGMAFGGELRGALGGREILLDHAYLTWYVFELLVKAVYYQRELLCGPVSVVWWNWMDLLIVLSGVTEQWVIPFLTFTGMPGVKLNLTMLRGLRFLRFLRVLRALKLVRVLLQGDFNWVHSHTYEIIGTVILGVNSITMAVELDHPHWPVWKILNSLFLVFYTFDIVCRLKLQGIAFFYDRDTLGWNYLDLVVVMEGVVDQWALPGVQVGRAFLSGEPVEGDEGSSKMGILKIVRLLRILRLARLCRSIPPLYRLMQGVAEALRSLRWVLVLTLVVIYSGAIVFTTMVTQDMIEPNRDEDADTFEFFGKVPDALYSLFTIMTGDMQPAEALGNAVAGKLALVGFMICSNWAILAILTAVVSENMISTSKGIVEKDVQQRKEAEIQLSREKMAELFRRIDSDGNGTIEEDEWQKLVIEDSKMVDALCAAVASLGKEELKDAFEAVVSQSRDEMEEATRRRITFEEFAQYLVKDKQVEADRRSILKIRQHLVAIQKGHLETSRSIDIVLGHLAELNRRLQFNNASNRSAS